MSMGSGGTAVTYELHEIEFEITASTIYSTILNTYIQESSDWCYFPIDGNTNLNTIARGAYWPQVDRLGDTGSAAGNTAMTGNIPLPVQYYINDQTYSAVRLRGNVNSLSAGRYKLKFYGIAK